MAEKKGAQNLQGSDVIAKLFDVTPRRIQQLTKEGVIVATKEGNAYKYDLLPTIQRYIKYLSDKANGRDKKDEKTDQEKARAEADLKRARLTWPRSSSRSSREKCTAAKMLRH